MDAIQRPGDEVVDQAHRLAGRGPQAAVLRLGPPLRPARALRGARAVSRRVSRRRWRARTTPRSRSRTPRWAGCSTRLDAARPAATDTLVVVAGRPRRDAGRARRADARLLRLRARRPTCPLIVAGPGVPARVVPDQVRIGGRDADRARPAGRGRPRRGAGRRASRRSARGERLGARRALRELVSALPLRLERAAVRAGRALQAHPRAAARALRPAGRSRARRTTSRDEQPERVAALDARAPGDGARGSRAPRRRHGPRAGRRRDRGTAGGARLRRRRRQRAQPGRPAAAATPRTRSGSTTS